ncbi:MAG: alpha/beta fold hydrolase [Bacteroidota bacterium]
MNLKSLFTLLLIACGISKLSAQNLPAKTTWEGNLNNIKIILRVFEDTITKEKKAEFDVPQQGAKGLKVSKLIITNDSVAADAAVMASTYKAAFNTDKTTITGVWNQRGGNYPLTFKRIANVIDKPATVFIRPQMPKGPFPYLEEKVIYHNADKSIQYGATLTLPKLIKPATAVILITGSGQEDRDETLFGHKLFWVIADHLSRNGIAVLRVDDRGVGETTGDVKNATSVDFAKDVLVGVNYLKTHAGINPKNIGLIGHSEGGMIAPIAAVASKDIAFIVSLAGVGIPGAEISKRQQADAYKKLAFTNEELTQLKALGIQMTELANEKLSEDETKPRFRQLMKNWMDKQPESFLQKAGFSGPNAGRTISQMASMFFSPWAQYFINYDPATTLGKLTIPVLALNGDKDVQVRADENLAGFTKLLTQAGNKNFKTISLPGLNHFLQHAETGEVAEYEKIEETISPEALDIITKWIKELKSR